MTMPLTAVLPGCTAALAACAMLAAAGAASAASTITLTSLYDASTAAPGGSGDFTSFNPPALDGDSVAIRGSDGTLAVFVDPGTGLVRYADVNTAVPGGGSNFFLFNRLALSGTTVAFREALQDGIYLDAGSGPVVVADTATQVPGASSGTTFTGFGDRGVGDEGWINGGDVVFLGHAGTDSGIYVGDGATLNLIADESTTVPGTANTFLSFDIFPTLDAGTVAFIGRVAAGEEAVVTAAGATLTIELDEADADAAAPGSVTNLDRAIIDDGHIAFVGRSTSYVGVMLYDGATVRVIADTTTLIPGGTGTFLNFSAHAISGGSVAVFGTGPGDQRGAYIDRGHGLEKVLAQGDVIDGRTVVIVGMDFQALSGDAMALYVVFDDGEQTIYLAEFSDPVNAESVAVPVPPWMMTVLALLLVAGGAAAARRHRDSGLR